MSGEGVCRLVLPGVHLLVRELTAWRTLMAGGSDFHEVSGTGVGGGSPKTSRRERKEEEWPISGQRSDIHLVLTVRYVASGTIAMGSLWALAYHHRDALQRKGGVGAWSTSRW